MQLLSSFRFPKWISLSSPHPLSTWIVYRGQINLLLFSGAWQVEKWGGEELGFHTGDKAEGKPAWTVPTACLYASGLQGRLCSGVKGWAQN